MKKNKIIRSITLVGMFLPITMMLNYALVSLTLPIFGRFDFTHLPTLVLAVTGHPWLAAINGFLGDVLGAMLRGFTPWLQISFAKGAQGLIAGYMSIWWIKNLNKKIDWKFVLLVFILLYFVVEFIGYAEAFRFWAKRPVAASAAIFFPARVLKIILMLPLWYYVITYFANKNI